MSINHSAYDTTAMAAWPTKSILDHVTQAAVNGSGTVEVTTGHHETPFPMVLIQGGEAFSDQVPFFRHPVIIPNSLGSGDRHPKIMAVDVRDFGKWYAPTREFQVRSGGNIEYAWHLRRAVINQLWLDGRPETLRDISTLPVATYAALVAECVSRKFSLNPFERMTVAVIAAYFYYGLFTDEADFGEQEKPLLLAKVAQITRVPTEQVMSLLEHQPVMHSLEDFIRVVQERVGNVALENFNLGTFLALMGGLWAGSNARELMCVALEHVPTWLSIVASSFDHSVYRRSNVAKMAQNFDKGGASAAFTRSLEVLMGGPKAVVFAHNNELDLTYTNFFHV